MVVSQWATPSAFLAKSDSGAFGAQGHAGSPDSGLLLLAGELTLRAAGMPNRAAELEQLQKRWSRLSASLTEADGTFAMAGFRVHDRELILVTDKLGVRPLYAWWDEGAVIFASTLKLLRALPFVPKRPDLQGLAESSLLGYALENRTEFQDIRLLAGGTVHRFGASKYRPEEYWCVDRNAVSPPPLEEAIREVKSRFDRAVDRRCRGDLSTAAFLSGGLDSRMVVAALRRRDLRVATFNFSMPGSQDQLFARAFADKVVTTHHERPVTSRSPDWSRMMEAALRGTAFKAERPRIVWSGDGGSVGVGHVYVTAEITAAMRAGDPERAAQLFLTNLGVAIPRIFRPSSRTEIQRVLLEGVANAIRTSRCEDPARAFYHFLMRNDQRRHLARHFEEIADHRIEFHLPFFDGAFLDLVTALPMDAMARHGFYVAWVLSQGGSITAVPWQAYPGHEPCPIPVRDVATYQWSEEAGRANMRRSRREILRVGVRMLFGSPFPAPYIGRARLAAAVALTAAGISNHAHAIRVAESWQRVWTPHEPSLLEGAD